MNEVLINFGVVLVFVIIGGFFSASEFALVSLREGQIQRLKEERPKAGGRLARLANDPNRLLAAVQVGVTLAGFLSAGFGASRIAPQISPALTSVGMGQGVADTVSFVAVTIVIVYLSLVLGELAPKRLALQRTEGIAVWTAGVVDWLARISRPFIWLLSVSTDGVVRMLGGDPSIGREHITEDELRGLVATHTELTEAERELIDDVFAAGDRELKEVMVPRTEVDFLDHDMPLFQAAELVQAMPHSRYPVTRDSADDIIGFIHIRDLFNPALAGRSVRIGSLVRDVARMPGSKRVIPALAEMRDGGWHLAIVEDEYGGTDGIVTMEDLVEELVGDIRDEYDESQTPDRPEQLRVPAEPWETDGLTNLDDFAEESGITVPDGPYETVAGYVVHRLGRLPAVGDQVDTPAGSFTIIELDGRRIARLRVDPRQPEPQS
jgi:putative hemolysin